MVGSKGALIFTVLVTAALVALPYLRGNAPLWSFLAVLAIYAAVGIVTGIRTQDYHVIGFVGGVWGSSAIRSAAASASAATLRSTQRPSIGPARSSSATSTRWSKAPSAFCSTRWAFRGRPLAVLVWLAVKLWGLYMRSHDRLFAAGAFAVLTVTVNGIFQEEALFSPLAMGIVVALAGLLLGRAHRTMPAEAAARQVATRLDCSMRDE